MIIYFRGYKYLKISYTLKHDHVHIWIMTTKKQRKDKKKTVPLDSMWETYLDLRVMEEVKVIEENWSGDTLLLSHFSMTFFLSTLASIRSL